MKAGNGDKMTKNVTVKESKINGKGVFASRDFNKDEFILRIDGEIVETDNPSSFPKEIQNHWFPFDRKGKTHKYFLPASPWKYLNHSCNPNAGIKNNREIVAIRPIKKGEEITFDYAMNNIDEWKMKCKCGSENCRKIISAFNALDDKTKKKYSNYVIDYIREKYLQK